MLRANISCSGRRLALVLRRGGWRSGASSIASAAASPPSGQVDRRQARGGQPDRRGRSGGTAPSIIDETQAKGSGDGLGVSVLTETGNRLRAPRVLLQKGKARLFWDGNPVVYGGAVSTTVPGDGLPLGIGSPVLVADHTGRPIAWGMFNPTSMYRVRLLGSARDAATFPHLCLDVDATIAWRIRQSAEVRARLGLPRAGVTTCYRLINSEGDGLSGIVADVFANVIVVQCTAAWAHSRRSAICHAFLNAVPHADVVLWRPQLELLQKEGLNDDQDAISTDSTFTRGSGDAAGAATAVPDRLVVFEEGVKYNISLLGGQKTGFYCDQRDNRGRVRQLVSASGARSVLDLCCYSGGFALAAALGGASTVVGVDSSGAAVELATSNAALNGCADACSFVRADVMEYLQAAQATHAGKYDVVVLDPPKLAPNKHALAKAAGRYRRLNSLAAALVAPGGVLLSCTCSGAMAQSGEFPALVASASAAAGRHAVLLGRCGPALCHVTTPSYGEGNYLEACLFGIHGGPHGASSS